MMMLDNGRGLMDQESGRARSVGATLRRFVAYFRTRWYLVLGAFVLIVFATWTQVYSPEVIGQAIDCYLFPQNPADCWFAPITADMTDEAKIAGLGSIVLVLAGLYALGAVANGLGFFLMTRAGQHALTRIRKDLFTKIQQLTLGYYAEHEAGDIMSRVTSDSETIQQVFSFGLVQVFSGFLLMIWIAVNMLRDDLVYGLISLAVVPIMFVATVYFSGQARKAFRQSRQQMGSVNADLQESIAGVREVQAFNREDENIANFENVKSFV
jgi:ATP-binding cassette subfamily B protein